VPGVNVKPAGVYGKLWCLPPVPDLTIAGISAVYNDFSSI